MVGERRQHARLVPSSPMFVSLDESKSGLLLDVGPGGVAVASLIPRGLDDVISLAFELPEGNGQVQAVAEVAWVRDAGHLTGVRFLSVDELSRQQLRDWINATSNPTRAVAEDSTLPAQQETLPAHAEAASRASEEPAAVASGKPSPVVDGDSAGAVLRDLASPGPDNPREEAIARGDAIGTTAPQIRVLDGVEPQILTDVNLSGGSLGSRHTFELILAVVLITWALVFLGYQMGSTGVSREAPSDGGTATKTNEAPAKNLVRSVEASATPAPARERPSVLTLADTGVVLQVGAMRIEDNAETLAQELQKKNLPAFVFRRGSDHLYHVAVGPYSDAEAAAKVKGNLEKQGLKPILRHWLPE
jgi:cell division septation protein DedD